MKTHSMENTWEEWPNPKELADAYMQVREECVAEMIQLGVVEENIEFHPWRVIDKVSEVGYNFELTSLQSFGMVSAKFTGTPFIRQ